MVNPKRIDRGLQRWQSKQSAGGDIDLLAQGLDDAALVDACFAGLKGIVAACHHHGQHLAHMADDQL